MPVEIKSLPISNEIEFYGIGTRAQNLKFKNNFFKRKRGIIGCPRNLRYNVLLPSGDVILCCMDYGMKHTLGNLISSDYNSLFRSEEFLKVEKGLRDESFDILCRCCDAVCNLNWFAEFHNFYLSQILRNLKNMHSFNDFLKFAEKAIL